MFTATAGGFTDLRDRMGAEDLTPLVLLLALECFLLSRTRVKLAFPRIASLEPVFVASLIVASVIFRGPGQQFVYFQF
jgi:hypothetical protein